MSQTVRNSELVFSPFDVQSRKKEQDNGHDKENVEYFLSIDCQLSYSPKIGIQIDKVFNFFQKPTNLEFWGFLTQLFRQSS